MSDAVPPLAPGRVAFGLPLPVVAQTTLVAMPWEAGGTSADILRVARAADAAGYAYVSACDHVAIPRAYAPAMSTTWYDPIATLGFVAAATERVRLLTSVYVLPYRHPLIAAKAFATLDALSGGRVIIGLGAGHVAAEFAQLGVDIAERGRRLDEGIDLLTAALTAEYPAHEGAFWSVRDFGLRPRPVQQPRPPIWIGGSTRAALRRAAERGDGWIPQGVPAEGMAAAIEYIRSRRAMHRPGAPIDLGGSSGFLYVGHPGFAVPEGTRSGRAEELAAPLRALAALGVSHITVRFATRSATELVEQLEAFARDVAPLVRQ